jgi:hypothetical protein
MAGHDYLISSLHDALQNQGAVVHSYGMCGASADAWLNRTTVSCGRAERHEHGPTIATEHKQEFTWTINELLAKHHPNLVVVEAGDAMAGYGSPQMPKAWIYEQSHSLAGRIASAGAGCIWVGPVYGEVNSPYHKSDDRVRELSQFLSQSVAPCHYVDSTQFVKPGEWRTTDGQHLTAAGYRAWGQDIADSVARIKGKLAAR